VGLVYDPRELSEVTIARAGVVGVLQFKPSGKNLINPPKFNLHMTFKNMNLDWLTCIQKFGVPLQIINMT
jgi:hypothetical protein